MATLAVDITGIAGDCAISGCAGQLDAIGITESVFSTAASADSKRSVDIELIRYKDSASPLLAQACASGKAIGGTDAVTISVLRDGESSSSTFMEYELKGVYVKRIQSGTLDQANLGHQPGGLEGAAQGLALSGGFTNTEIERVLLNVASVEWNYKGGDATTGSIRKGYNLAAGTTI